MLIQNNSYYIYDPCQESLPRRGWGYRGIHGLEMYAQDLITITHMSRSSLDLQKLLTSWVSHPLRRKFPQPRNSFVNRLFLLFLFKSTPYPWLWITWPLEWSFLLPYLWVKYNLIGLFHLKIYLSPTCWLWNICEPALENNCHPSPVLDKLFCCAQEQTDIHHLELFERREQWHLEEEKNAVEEQELRWNKEGIWAWSALNIMPGFCSHCYM